jgi:hypothetical protein
MSILRFCNEKFFYIVLFLFSNSAYCHDWDFRCGNRTISVDNGKKRNFDMVIHCPYYETDTTQIPQQIMEISRKYLFEKSGLHFYNNFMFYSCQIIDFKKYRKIKKEKPYIDKKMADKRVKYALQYYFVIQDSVRYYFSLVYDKNARLISEDFIPDQRKNNNAYKIINICEAAKISEKDSLFKGDLQNIYLDFLPKENTFIWVAEKPEVRKGREITFQYIIINAFSGKIIDHKCEYRISVCNGAWF